MTVHIHFYYVKNKSGLDILKKKKKKKERKSSLKHDSNNLGNWTSKSCTLAGGSDLWISTFLNQSH